MHSEKLKRLSLNRLDVLLNNATFAPPVATLRLIFFLQISLSLEESVDCCMILFFLFNLSVPPTLAGGS